MAVLTSTQADLIDAVRSFQEANGYPPTIRELAEQAGLRSPGWVHHQLGILENQGLIRRSPDRRRLIQLTEGA